MTSTAPLAQDNREIMIVAGEASGDLHGAHLVAALRRREPSLRFSGMGGPTLAAAGVERLYDAAKLAVVGAVEVLSHLGDILRARRALIKRLRHHRPALLILIDYPDFNLWLAKSAKELGIPVFYYVSPQIWAWRRGRVHTIKRRVDRMAVILPFEQAFYAQYGMDVAFVGHPLLDSVVPGRTPEDFRRFHGIPADRRLLGLLPGSRTKEIAALLPDFLAAAGLLAQQIPGLTVLIPQAPTVRRALLEEHGLANWRDRLDIRVISEDRYAMMAACEAAIAASGTVILELAILGVPTVAAYRTNRQTYWLGRLLIRTIRFFSLVNLIAEREVIPELLQDQANPENMARVVGPMLTDPAVRAPLLAGLNEVRQRLGGPGASDRVATEVLQLLARGTNARG